MNIFQLRGVVINSQDSLSTPLGVNTDSKLILFVEFCWILLTTGVDTDSGVIDITPETVSETQVLNFEKPEVINFTAFSAEGISFSLWITQNTWFYLGECQKGGVSTRG